MKKGSRGEITKTERKKKRIERLTVIAGREKGY